MPQASSSRGIPARRIFAGGTTIPTCSKCRSIVSRPGLAGFYLVIGSIERIWAGAIAWADGLMAAQLTLIQKQQNRGQVYLRLFFGSTRERLISINAPAGS